MKSTASLWLARTILCTTRRERSFSQAFAKADVGLTDLSLRRFPGELIIIAEVLSNDFAEALIVASDLDAKIENGFVSVRKASEDSPQVFGKPKSLLDPRVNDLIEVLNARSRTSEHQPSLRYIRDAAENLKIAVSRRHNIIFGRRGVGKTALMVEAKQLLDERGATTFWVNVQTVRALNGYEAFLTIAARLCDLPELAHAGRGKETLSLSRSRELRRRLTNILTTTPLDKRLVHLIIPEIQQLLALLSEETQDDIYIFLDDFHYLPIKEQPILLDMLHAITRDSSVWIKASAIKHQSRWFTDNPPTGLQTGHDAAVINLDVTLEQPAKAKELLVDILKSYTQESKLGSIGSVISQPALDRLVLASGGVPRDFLVLSATAIQIARQRAKAKAAGVQDVNEAAGTAAQTKLQDLEEDAASSIGKAEARMSALTSLRHFLLEEKQTTYFRVDFRDKESHPKEYELMQSLMDLRLLHLINAGLSDEREAGRRSEVYMLDLSEFSGTRFRRNLRVLDLEKNHLVLKSTGGSEPVRLGDTPRKLQSILRRGPLYNLSNLELLN